MWDASQKNAASFRFSYINCYRCHTKGSFHGIAIALIILPAFLPAPMHKMLPVLQLQFSVTQLITAVIGGVYAVIIAAVLKKLL